MNLNMWDASRESWEHRLVRRSRGFLEALDTEVWTRRVPALSSIWPLWVCCVTLRNNKVWVEDLGAETRVPVALGCALASLKANKSYCVVMACFLLGEKCSRQFWHMDEVCLYSSWNDTIDPNSFGRFFRLFCTMQFSLILHKICLQTITVGDVPIWLLQ